jgi:pimeloyl-ACP methyl ester carboxylesterase
MDAARAEGDEVMQTAAIKNTVWSRQGQRMLETHTRRMQKFMEDAQALVGNLDQWQAEGRLDDAWSEYQRDAAERAVLIADTLRKRGDIFLDHEAADCPPVLDYEYEVVMDGRTLLYPCNYMLLKILPPSGGIAVNNKKRPYIIIDPRAGHGPGIGGFKQDSQVGVALAAGHPVYFVAFRSRPEPGQRLSHVTRAEAAFVREVMRRHPKSPKPAVTGNCQGGWAALLLAATNPDLTGPIVVNGAPVVPWAGVVGENPMRYNAGVLGGTWVPMFFSDLGGGIFDGAHLVQNFEILNPGRTLFRKYTDLFRDIDKGDKSFLDCEKWWGGFFMLTEAEICWIVEQLFVGNRLAKNEARLEPGRSIDLKMIRAPIIAFASRGDNITPPQQALNWIPETYADEHEIRIRGQRIVYMLHEEVGHLGIFVSSKIARREHAQVESSMEMIEALAPGLYEMVIDDITEHKGEKTFSVSFSERTMDDIRALDDSFNNEQPFAAVARASEIQTQLYDALVRPVIKAAVTPTLAELSRILHPKRLERALASSRNPLMAMVSDRADDVRNSRRKAAPNNPFLAAEALWVEGVEQMIDFLRDSRDMAYELSFFQFWATPWMRTFGRSYEAGRTHKSTDELRTMPEVATALHHIGHGGFSDAVIRMLVLLAGNRGNVRRDRLERSEWLLTQDEAFKSLGEQKCALMIREQSLIITYEHEQAIKTLPALLPDAGERERALRMVRFVVGSEAEMAPETHQLIERLHAVLGQQYLPGEVVTKPRLKNKGNGKATA